MFKKNWQALLEQKIRLCVCLCMCILANADEIGTEASEISDESKYHHVAS